MRRENLTALSQPLTGDDKHQNPTGLEPAIGVAQERLLCATTVSRPECPIVGWIQIQEAKTLDGALHFQRISLDNVGNPLPGLIGTVGIKLDAITKHLSTLSDGIEGHAIADTGIKCRRGLVWEQEKPANPLGFRQWQRKEPESAFALEAQGWAPF
jgi:hypothetical protein